MAQKRRDNGEGSLIWSEKEGTWIAQVTLPDGKRKRKRSKDKKVVQEWLLEHRLAFQEGRVVPDGSMSVTEFLTRFLEDTAKHTLKPKTFSSYKWILEKHVIPEIGRVRLSALQPQHLQSLYSKKVGEGLSKKTVVHIHATIRRALNEAVKWNLIYKNPCDSVTPPRPERKTPKVWTVREAQKFLEAVRDHRWYGIYLIALTTGTRRGEVLGLEWENIDWDESRVSIEKTINEVSGKVKVTSPKTKSSRRTINLPDYIMEVLEPMKESQGFIFRTSKGTPVAPRNLLRHFYSVLDKLEIPRIRFHDLRHTCATILFQKGVNAKKVQELLGHASIVQTLDTYTMYIPSQDREISKKMNDLFKN